MSLTTHQIDELNELIRCPFEFEASRYPLGMKQLICESWITLLHEQD